MQMVNQNQAAQTTDEIVGILTAISIVSKRLAENLKKQAREKEGDADADAN